MFPSFELFGRQIGLYGVFAVLGVLFAGFVASRLIKKFNITFEDTLLIMLATLFSGFIFGHLVYGLTNFSAVVKMFAHIGDLWFEKFIVLFGVLFGGMVYYGGFIGGIIGILIYTHFDKNLNRNNVLDIYAVVMPAFHIFGRIGCFFGGCCYGIESDFGFTVTNNTINPSINGVNRFPVQLLESLLNLLIFLVLLYLIKHDKCVGNLLYIYMIIYPIVRFFD